MNEDKKRKTIKTVVVAIFIGIPVLVMFYDVAVGSFLLIFGAYIVSRAVLSLGKKLPQVDRTQQLHNANAAGKTIFVQVVDNFGRDLSPGEVERRLAEARAKADPRDTIMPVRFKVELNKDKK